MSAKAVLLAACSLLVFGAQADSQTRVGLFGTANFGELNPEEPVVTYTTRAFPGLGVIIDVDVGRNVCLRAEPMFLRKGSDFAVEPDDFLFEDGLSGSLRFDYLELPLLVVVSKGGTGLRPYAMAGPTFGYLLDAEVRALGEEMEVTDGVKRGDLGVSFGGGLKFPAGRASVFVEARYSQGLWAVFKDTRRGPRPRNRGLLVGAGVTFPIGGTTLHTEPTVPSVPERDGFWMGFGLGYGHADASCEDAVLPDCDNAETAGGATGLLTMGWTLTPKLLLGVEASFWSGHSDTEPSLTEFGDFLLLEGPTLGNVSIAGYFYPLRARGLFVKAGAGLSLHAPSREGISTRRGWGWTAGLGYDFRVARGVSLTPVASFLFGSVGDLTLFPSDDVPPELEELASVRGVKHDVFELGLRVTVH